MKNKMTIALAVLALGASAFIAGAQDENAPNGDASSGRPMNHHRPPPSPIFQALDVNHDGVIDANEIANAPAELKTLDKNGDGQLTRDELRPQRPDDAPGGPPPNQ